MNLLTKGSLRHCEGQLRKTPQQHLDDIRRTLDYAVKKGIRASIYMEDWSNGMLHSRDYVHFMLSHYVDMPFERILLPDTLGILDPWQVEEFIRELVAQYGHKKEFEFPGHNDYGLAVANSLAAVRADARHPLHGQRPRRTRRKHAARRIHRALHDHTEFRTRVRESELVETSRLVVAFSGKRIASNKPVCGSNVFTQTAGIHADGDKKGNLYASALTPERFGRDRSYALGKLSGRANLDFNLQRLQLNLTPSSTGRARPRDRAGRRQTQRHHGRSAFIISDVLESPGHRQFEVQNCVIVSSKSVRPVANIVVRFRDRIVEAQSSAPAATTPS
jgi:D-citramalate synthase